MRDFEANQTELLMRLRRWHLPQYAQMISRLLPRDGVGDGSVEVAVGDEAVGAAEAAAMAQALRAALEVGGERLAALEALIEGVAGPGVEGGDR